MFIYLLLIPALIILSVGIFEYLNILKNDRILFSFCQLRRNILALLKEKGISMSDEDYKLLNSISQSVDVTIHEFREFKSNVFNVRKAKKILMLSKKASGRSYIFKESDNKEIRDIQEELKYIIFKSALAYTPFLRSEILMRFVLVIVERIAEAEFNIKIRMSKNTHRPHRPKTKAQNFLSLLEEYFKDLVWSKQTPRREGMFV